MRKIFLGCFISLLVPLSVFSNSFTKTRIEGIDFRYVTYGINSDLYKLKVLTSENAQNLEDIAINHNAITAINGVFFCPSDYPECGGKDYTINERFVNGEDKSFYEDTGDRGVFGWDKNGKPFIHQTAGINAQKRSEIYEGLGNFPILFADGTNMLEYYHDVGLYDIKMKTPLPRHFICSDKNKSKIIFGRTSSVSLDNLAPALYKLGCWDALNLDAGNSAQFVYNGRKIVSGPRPVLDGFGIERVGLDIKAIESKLDTLFPILLQAYKNAGHNKKISELENLSHYIGTLRLNLYDKNSHNIYDSDGTQIGYQINTIDLGEIKKIYVYNGLQRRIQEEISNIITQRETYLLEQLTPQTLSGAIQMDSSNTE